ncbi:MAG: hypothetical protein QXG00_02835 [Candidatus Woesearchaeota archaeon]
MMFEDKYGRLLTSDEVDKLAPWEIEENLIHVYDSIYDSDIFV